VTPDICPNCGADVPPGAKACPECGSCDKTGWSDQTTYDGLDLPDQEFDYAQFVRREFEGKDQRGWKPGWLWWAAGLIALTAFVALLLLRL
jgi:hypothetical protein